MPSPLPKSLLTVVLLSVPMVAAAETRVFLLGGQSNMVGQGINAELDSPYDTPQPDVNFWNGNRWVPVSPGFGRNTASFGPEVSFGRAVKDAMPRDDIYLVKYAVGGTALYNDWAPTGGPQYVGFVNRVEAALGSLDAAGIDYEISAMLWMQGESDAFEKQAAGYESNLRNFIVDMRTRYNTPEMPFILGRVLDYYGGQSGQADIVRAAQVNVAETAHNVEWFDTDDYSRVNAGHYGTQGQIDMGNDFAAAYVRMVPEPSTIILLGVAVVGILLLTRGRHKRTGSLLLCLILTLTARPAAATDYKVFLLGGQSNMQGSGLTADLPAELRVPQPDVLLYQGNALTPLAPSGSTFGPEVTFGRTIADAFPNEDFALIKYAVGGTNLYDQWDPATGGTYASFRTKVAGGLAALRTGGNTTEIVGMLWTQGERDARLGRTMEQYQADLIEFVADVRSRYGADLPFFLSRLSSLQTNLPAAGLEAVRAAQANVAAADPTVHMIDADPFRLKSDSLHFDAAGQQALGQAFGNAYIATIPEPSTLALLGIGLLACLAFRRR